VQSHCQCESGWTGRGDLKRGIATNCDVHELTVTILWSYGLFLALINVTIFLYGVMLLCRRKQIVSNLNLGVLGAGGISGILWVLLAALKLTTSQDIGFDWLPTILYALFCCIFTLAFPLVVALFIDLTHSAHRGHKLGNPNRTFGMITVLTVVSSGVIPIVAVMTPTDAHTTRDALNCASLLLIVANQSLITWYIYSYIMPIYRALQNQKFQDKRLKANLVRLGWVIQTFAQSVPPSTPVLCAVALWPFLRDKIPYSVPFTWALIFPTMTCVMAATIPVRGASGRRDSRRETHATIDLPTQRHPMTKEETEDEMLLASENIPATREIEMETGVVAASLVVM